jgi:iron complex outermembrane recepter protein
MNAAYFDISLCSDDINLKGEFVENATSGAAKPFFGLKFLIAQSAAIALIMSAQPVRAASASSSAAPDSTLEEVVVTGSLIPQVRAEISTPVTVITAADIDTKGFVSVADALQHTSFATGAVQGAGYSGGFTQGIKTFSLFGLSPSYTKILIDGRPLADYPALYNGTDIVPNVDGIPTELVDHIDILPGGQSSIYGSDAIAGVVNVVMKKQMDGPTIDVRDGWYTDGGGGNRRIALADGFSAGGIDILAGAQYERIDPIWGYQRNDTSHYFAGGSSPQTAARNWLVDGYYGQPNGDLYYFLDPANCANVASQFNNTVGVRSRQDRGNYCGSFNGGLYTVSNGQENTDGYLHISDDINSSVQVFADVLLSHDVEKFSTGTALFSTADDSAGPFGYYEDTKVTGPAGGPTSDYLNLQRIFSPEEAGGLQNTRDKNTLNGVRATLGVKGAIFSSNWNYSFDFTYTENKLTEVTNLAFEDPINNFFAPIMGPNLGFDPVLGANLYSPNYAAFYQPLTPAQYASFTGDATSYSRTEESVARAEVVNSSLFALPGGNAGLAVVFDGGGQGWDYTPDPRFLDGGTYLYTATAGSGHRSRYSGTTEMKLPVVQMLTFDLSGRYDDYRVDGNNVDKFTYNIAAEFRPFGSQLLIRGRYGTAFKAPTLSDEFQGQSGFYFTGTDYYTCTKNGYTATTLSNCPQANTSYFGTTSGTPGLKPITANVWDIGLVYTPVAEAKISVDFIDWAIRNEVEEQNSDQLLRVDSACLLGQLDVTSPTCVQALAAVVRDDNGNLVSVSTPKINVAQENLSVVTAAFDYMLDIGRFGSLLFDGAYTDVLKHDSTQFTGDQVIDLLESPFYNTDFKTKENFSVTWNFHNFGTTFYVERYGETPNYLASLTTDEYNTPGAGRVGSWTLANWSARYEIIRGLVVSANVNNVFNKEPPKDNSWPGIYDQPYNPLNYNNYGRGFLVEASYKFGK